MSARIWLPVAAIFVAAGIVIASNSLWTSGAPVAFTENFDGIPSSPAPFDSPHWDVQVHERQMPSMPLGVVSPLNAQHGPGCEGPSVTHLVDTQEKAVFRCNDHVMTALNGTEYGVIYLTPDAMLDWSGGTATLEFSVSTKAMSQRDWIDFYITPYAQNMALPLSPNSPDLNGEPAEFLKFTIEHGGELVLNGQSVNWPIGDDNILDDGIPASVDQSATRQPFKLTIGGGRIKFERMGTYPRVYFDVARTPSFTSGIVQFGHHSYDPEKDNSGVPATWHWDNVVLTPAIPFTMGDVLPRALADPGTVTFAPAPAGAMLRFSAWGSVTVNGATCAPQRPTFRPESANSFFCPIPAGSTSATVSANFARDFALWTLNGGTSPTSTPTSPPAPSATATASPVPPTATSTNTPPPPTLAATATASPSRTPTSTPTPVLRTCTLRWGSTTIETYGQLSQADCAARGQ